MSNDLVPVLETLLAEVPEVGDLAQQVKEGKITREEAFTKLVLLSKDSRVESSIKEALAGQIANVKEASDEAVADLYRAHPDAIPRLNPLVESAIAERLQFDGDIPELRTGPMPEGTKPALSVEIENVVSPVALGMMLEQASEEMLEKIETHHEQLKQEGAKLLEQEPDSEGGLPAVLKDSENPWVTSNALVQKNIVVGPLELPTSDHPEYRRSTLPAPVKIEKPTGSALAALSDQDRVRFTWKAISTTQGRRSASPVVQKLMFGILEKKGVAVSVAEEEGEPVFSYSWTMGVADSQTINPNFSPINNAAHSLANAVIKNLGVETPHAFRVVTCDAIADREVGWTVHAYER